ncbi:ATP-binding protein [Zobellella sp. An-6]|uniref:ATP-binding protein n=1 Tax=Zobellella sp. An-6 TaxID=3400218 RepID=UPI00404146D8
MPEIPAPSSPLHVRFGEFEVDEPNALLLRNGSAIALSPTPFGLLCALLRQPGSLLTKHVLLDQVWGHSFVSDSVLKGAISDVRSVLGDDPRQPRYIETVPRRGYRFIATPEPLSEAVKPVAQATDAPQPAPPQTDSLESKTESAPLFVGRAAELARLRRVWDRVVRGGRAITWVAGEPGIGKTTLIEHFASGLGDIARAHGQCVQHHGPGEPYLPVLEALAELCRHDPEATVLLRTVAPTWLLQMPWLSTAEQREALLHELVGANPQRMLREMGEFMDRYTERQPLLLITEDLQWADRSTIQLIDYVARRRGSCRLMWLSTFRLTEIIALDHPLNALRHELRPQGLCDEIVVDSFSETEVATFVAGRAPEMADDERFVRALHERTGGVPLFVAAIASEVIEQARCSGSVEAARLASTTVPESLSALVDHYVARLAGERRALLSAAAVCGMELRIDTLSRVLGCDAVQIAQTCDELARERLWLAATPPTGHGDGTEGSYAFRHALFRQRLYDGMASPARAELHRKVGAALEDERAAGLGVTAAELATHFDRGRLPMTALHYYAEATQAALLHLSPAEGLSLTERALALADQAPADAERRSLEITLATLRGVAAFHTLGAGDEAKNAYLRASALLAEVSQHPMAGLALHGLGFLLYLRAEYPEALATAERAQALAAQSDDPLLTLAAFTVKGQVLMIQGDHLAAREALERALPALERASATAEQSFIGFIVDPRVTVLTMLSLPLAQLGLFNQARERLQQAYARARQLAQPMALMLTIWCDALCGIRRGDTARVGALAAELQSLADEFALAQGKTACRWFRGWADAHGGKPREGFRRIREAYEENRALGMISGGSETLGYAAEALVLQDDWAGAQEQLDQALDIVNTYGERIFLPQLLLIQAAIARSRGEPAAAEASIRHAIMEARTQGASWLELLAFTELFERAEPSSKDRRALAALVVQLGEADDTSLLARARNLIQNERQE